jgi:hypothetical protein
MYNQKKFSLRYLPHSLSKSNQRKQYNMLSKSVRMYKKNKYYTRNKLKSYKSKQSKHILKARQIYNINSIKPSKELSKKTGCSISALKKIVRKGEGAYYSSGSRPSQTPQSWGIARLASAITSGKSSVIDFNILNNGCNHSKKAYKLAKVRKNN